MRMRKGKDVFKLPQQLAAMELGIKLTTWTINFKNIALSGFKAKSNCN